MELKAYLRIIFRYWWIVLFTLASAVAFTYMFTSRQTPVYRAESTFVMRPRTSMVMADDEIVRLVDTLSRRIEINTTYAEVAESDYIEDITAQKLGLTPQQRKGISVNGRVIAGTNILEIAVEGPDPVLVRDFANTASAETKGYVSGLYDVFELEPLDAAKIATTPIRPQKTLNLILGAIIGLTAGITLIFLYVYLFEHEEEPVTFNIIDYDTGAYNQAYLKLRLWQEMSRSARNNGRFSLALLRIDHLSASETDPPIPAVVRRKISGFIRSNLRDEDVLARLDESTFALLLPGLPAEASATLLEELRNKIETTRLDLLGSAGNIYLQVVVGIATYDTYDVGLDEFLSQATDALHKAEKRIYRAVHLFPSDGSIPDGAETHRAFTTAGIRGK